MAPGRSKRKRQSVKSVSSYTELETVADPHNTHGCLPPSPKRLKVIDTKRGLSTVADTKFVVSEIITEIKREAKKEIVTTTTIKTVTETIIETVTETTEETKVLTATLTTLPAEILECVAWKATNPSLWDVSKRLRAILPNKDNFLHDMLMWALCGWRDAQKDPSLLNPYFLTSFASNDLEPITYHERVEMQRCLLDHQRCHLLILKAAGSDLSRAWLAKCFPLSVTRNEDVEKRKALEEGNLTHTHKVNIISNISHGYELRICNFSKMAVFCTSIDCEKSECIDVTELDKEEQIVSTTYIPTRVLRAPSGKVKTDFLMFLRCCRPLSASYYGHDLPWNQEGLEDAIKKAVYGKEKVELTFLIDIFDGPGRGRSWGSFQDELCDLAATVDDQDFAMMRTILKSLWIPHKFITNHGLHLFRTEANRHLGSVRAVNRYLHSVTKRTKRARYTVRAMDMDQRAPAALLLNHAFRFDWASGEDNGTIPRNQMTWME